MLHAQASVTTEKASRYLKALCNHFNKKVSAVYEDNHGVVQFGFGVCEMDVQGEQLIMRVQAENDELFARVKYVVADHLERFSGEEQLQVEWIDAQN